MVARADEIWGGAEAESLSLSVPKGNNQLPLANTALMLWQDLLFRVEKSHKSSWRIHSPYHGQADSMDRDTTS